jgi:hypothetical protein
MSKQAHHRTRTRRRDRFFSPVEWRRLDPATGTVSGALPPHGSPRETKCRLSCWSQTGADFASLKAAATRHCVPSRNPCNLLETNDRAPSYPTLNRGVCVPVVSPGRVVAVPCVLASLAPCLRKTRHTMQSNLWRISLKTNDGCTKEVTHKSRQRVAGFWSQSFNSSVTGSVRNAPTRPRFPPAKMITIARHRNTTVEEPCV